MTRRNPLATQTDAVTLATAPGADRGDLWAPALRYDYDLIAEEHRSPVMLAAHRIKLKGQRIKSDLLDIGKELTEAKQRLPHGQFGDWLSVEFEMSDRSARRFMRIYEAWGDNPDALSLLSDRALYLLADPDTPDEAKQAAIETARTTGRSPTAKQTQEIIATHKPPPPPPPPATIDMPLGLRALDTMATPFEDDEEEPDDTASAGVIDVASEAIEDTAQDDVHEVGAQRHEQRQQPELIDLVTMEAHIWRIALLEVGHDLGKLHQWITEHDQPGPYGPLAGNHSDTFAEAYAVVSQEIAAKYDYGNHPLPLPPHEEPAPPASTNANELRNWRIHNLIRALTGIEEIDFPQYSNITGDWTSPRKLTDIVSVMIHKLKGNLT